MRAIRVDENPMKYRKIPGKPYGDGTRPDDIIRRLHPANHKPPELPEGLMREDEGSARFGDKRREFRGAQRGEERREPRDHEGENNGRPGNARRNPHQHEYARTDDGPDTDGRGRPYPQSAFQFGHE